jgi:hypothetical protein
LPKRTNLALVAIVLMAQSSCNFSHDQLTFRAKVSDFRRPSNALIGNKKSDDTIEVTLPGKLLNPAQPIALVSRAQSDYSMPERAAVTIVSANTAGDVSWIVDNYLPEQRTAVAEGLSDPDTAQRNAGYYRALGKVSLTGWTEIRGDRVLFLQGVDEDGDATFIAITLSKTSSGWKQTDALQNDDTFELIWTALHTGGIR